MGIRTDIRDEIRKETVTKIHGQPTSHDLTNLEKEIIAILANIPTTLGGGNHGHLGLVMTQAAYAAMVPPPGEVFVLPDPPEPLNFQGNATAGTVALARAVHEDEMNLGKVFLIRNPESGIILMEFLFSKTGIFIPAIIPESGMPCMREKRIFPEIFGRQSSHRTRTFHRAGFT